jgi:chromate transport protein ChrA
MALTIIVGEVYPYLRRVGWVRGAIAGIMAGFTGLLASTVLTLARPILAFPDALGLAAAAFVAAGVLRANTPVIFAGGLAIWAVYLAAGGPA